MNLIEEKELLIKKIFKPAFKNEGFKISGTTFRKDEKDFIKIFNVQSSGFNSADHASFYLNIGFFFPIGYQLNEQEIPKQIKEYDCQLGFRSNSITNGNQSYDITPNVNLNELKEKIKLDLEQTIIPFYRKITSITDCLELNKLIFWNNCIPYVGWTLIKNGQVELADKLIDEYIKSPGVRQGWLDEVDEKRKKLKNDYLKQ